MSKNTLELNLIPYKNINKLSVKKYHIIDQNNMINWDYVS